MEKPIKITLPALACELHNLCNPRVTNCKISMRYYFGDQVSFVPIGVPTDYPVEIEFDILTIREALKMMDKLISKREREQKRYHELRLKGKNIF